MNLDTFIGSHSKIIKSQSLKRFLIISKDVTMSLLFFLFLPFVFKRRKPVPKRIKNILIISLAGGIGDNIIVSPIYERIKSKFGSARITVCLPDERTKQAILNNPYVDDVVFIGNILNPFNLIRRLDRLRWSFFDVVICVYPSGFFAPFLALIIRKGHVISHKYRLGYFKNCSFFIDSPVEIRNVHNVIKNQDLLCPLGINNIQKAPQIYVDKKTKEKINQFLGSKKIKSSDRLVGFHPGPDWGFSNVPKFYSKLLSLIIKNYTKYKILVFIGPSEKEFITKVLNGLEHNRNIIMVENFSFVQVCELLRKCSFFVSNDGGLAHASSAVGTRSFVLFGPTDYRATGAFGKDSFVIRKDLSCSPCYDIYKDMKCIFPKKDLNRNYFRCVYALNADEVMTEISNINRKCEQKN